VKHQLKLFLRECYARVVFHSGLHRLIDRVMPRRLTILAGHCVASADVNAGLPPDMKISAAKLEGLLRWLGQRYELCTVGDGVEALSQIGGRSLPALSMDDGYRESYTALLPLLERVGAKATVYLEGRVFSERRVNWSHKYFWLLTKLDPQDFGRRYIDRSTDTATNERLRRVLEEGGDLPYLIKRVFKYEAAIAERDRVIDELFAEFGGEEQALCDTLYLANEEARALQAAGVELGGHTHTHEVLAHLDDAGAAREIEAGRQALASAFGPETGRSFAYPFGRRWDFTDAAARATAAVGFASAVTTHAGTNDQSADRMRLARWMIDEDTRVHLVATEACGGFALLRRFGLDLSE